MTEPVVPHPLVATLSGRMKHELIKATYPEEVRDAYEIDCSGARGGAETRAMPINSWVNTQRAKGLFPENPEILNNAIIRVLPRHSLEMNPKIFEVDLGDAKWEERLCSAIGASKLTTVDYHPASKLDRHGLADCDILYAEDVDHIKQVPTQYSRISKRILETWWQNTFSALFDAVAVHLGSRYTRRSKIPKPFTLETANEIVQRAITSVAGSMCDVEIRGVHRLRERIDSFANKMIGLGILDFPQRKYLAINGEVAKQIACVLRAIIPAQCIQQDEGEDDMKLIKRCLMLAFCAPMSQLVLEVMPDYAKFLHAEKIKRIRMELSTEVPDEERIAYLREHLNGSTLRKMLPRSAEGVARTIAQAVVINYQQQASGAAANIFIDAKAQQQQQPEKKKKTIPIAEKVKVAEQRASRMKKLLVREKVVAAAKAEEERDTPVTIVAAAATSKPIGAAVAAKKAAAEEAAVPVAATEEEKKPEDIPLAVATEVPAQQDDTSSVVSSSSSSATASSMSSSASVSVLKSNIEQELTTRKQSIRFIKSKLLDQKDKNFLVIVPRDQASFDEKKHVIEVKGTINKAKHIGVAIPTGNEDAPFVALDANTKHHIDSMSRLVSEDAASKISKTHGVVYQVTPKRWANIQLLVEM